MDRTAQHDSWSAGQSYDHYMGRWSRLIAREFVKWLDMPQGVDWADIGCGTGALTRAILENASPESVIGIDPSDGFVAHARIEIPDRRAAFKVGDARDIALPDDCVDVAASALALNFIPDKLKMLGEMQRITRPGGTIAFYVWDYPGGGMGFIDAFWKAAAVLDPAARDLDEADRFPFCTPYGLEDLCGTAGIRGTVVRPIEIETVFPDFEAFWTPFTMGAGPAPGYCASLSEDDREKLRSQLLASVGGDKEIRLPARVWAATATNA